MEAYRRWVRKNKDYVRSLGSLANGLTWLLPEFVATSEIGAEAVMSITGIFTAINEHIIEMVPSRVNSASVDPHSFPWTLSISMIRNLETLVEVFAQQLYGDDKKWDFLAITEATKVVIRMVLLRDSGYKMLVNGGETPNVESNPNATVSHNQNGALMKPVGEHNGHNQWNLEGKALSALNTFGENARTVSNTTWSNMLQYQNGSTMEPPGSMVKRHSLSMVLSNKGLYGGLFITGEVLSIARPLIYVLCVRKYGVRSWIPWLLSLAVDLTGMSLISVVANSQSSDSKRHFPLSSSEKDEMKRRKLLLALYLMRDPFFGNYISQRLENTGKVLEPVPIIGFLTAKVLELIIGCQTRFTYMSGS